MVNGRQESKPILWVLTILCVSTSLRLAVDFKEAPSSLSESDDKVGRTWNSQICLQQQLQQQQWMRYLITILSHHLFSLHFLLPVICLASALHILSANIWRLQNVCVCVSRKCQEDRKQTTFFGGFLGCTALRNEERDDWGLYVIRPSSASVCLFSRLAVLMSATDE